MKTCKSSATPSKKELESALEVHRQATQLKDFFGSTSAPARQQNTAAIDDYKSFWADQGANAPGPAPAQAPPMPSASPATSINGGGSTGGTFNSDAFTGPTFGQNSPGPQPGSAMMMHSSSTQNFGSGGGGSFHGQSFGNPAFGGFSPPQPAAHSGYGLHPQQQVLMMGHGGGQGGYGPGGYGPGPSGYGPGGAGYGPGAHMHQMMGNPYMNQGYGVPPQHAGKGWGSHPEY
jgi:hypothetical protein